jgi:hypothetical protein
VKREREREREGERERGGERWIIGERGGGEESFFFHVFF